MHTTLQSTVNRTKACQPMPFVAQLVDDHSYVAKWHSMETTIVAPPSCHDNGDKTGGKKTAAVTVGGSLIIYGDNGLQTVHDAPNFFNAGRIGPLIQLTALLKTILIAPHACKSAHNLVYESLVFRSRARFLSFGYFYILNSLPAFSTKTFSYLCNVKRRLHPTFLAPHYLNRTPPYFFTPPS